jgi:hypothetical protein
MGREFLPAEQADSRGEFHARLELEYARVTSADARYADDHHGIAPRGGRHLGPAGPRCPGIAHAGRNHRKRPWGAGQGDAGEPLAELIRLPLVKASVCQ